MKKIISVFLVLIMAVLPLAVGFDGAFVTAYAEDIDYTCGENASWTLDTATGELTISGTGTVTRSPWRTYAASIKKVTVSEGITVLDGGVFYKLNKVVEINLPATLERIIDSSSLYSLETVNFPENSKLYNIKYPAFAAESKWYKSFPQGSVITFGPLAYAYSGTAPENATLTIPEGTKYINAGAFKNITNITNVVFPDTIEDAGYEAFKGTTWFNSLPSGAFYMGKALLAYIEPMPLSDADFTVKDGTVSVCAGAFYDNEVVTGITLPASVERIGERAFCYCQSLTSFNVPENSKLRFIGEWALNSCEFTSFNFPETLESIGRLAFAGSFIESVYVPSKAVLDLGAFGECSKIKSFEASPDNPYYSSEDGILYNKDKTSIVYFPAKTTLYEYTVPDYITAVEPYAFSYSQLHKLVLNDNIETVGEYAFYRSYTELIVFGKGVTALGDNVFRSNWGTHYLTVPENITTLGDFALGYHLDYIYFKGKDTVFDPTAFYPTEDALFYCYPDSTAYEYALDYSKISYVLLSDTDIGDYSEIDALLEKIKTLSPSWKSHFGYWELMTIIENMPRNISSDYQSAIDDIADRMIEELDSSMKIVWTDYSTVDAAVARAQAVDRRLYTDESLARLDEAVNSVVRYGDVADSVLIKEYADNINRAVDTLEKKTSDYSGVTDAIEAAEAVDRTLYTEASLGVLDAAVADAQNAYQSADQEAINAYADKINEAINSLKYKPADFSSLEGVIESANAVDRSLYTAESLARLDGAVAAIDRSLTIDKQSQVEKWASDIESAIGQLEYLPADFSPLEGVIESANAVDRSLYTAESLARLDGAVAAIDRSLTIDKQSQVEKWASDIESAIVQLEYLPADFSPLEDVIESANAVDRSLYTAESLARLDGAVAAIDRSLTIDKQSQVEKWASDIETAIGQLEYLPADYSKVNEQVGKANALSRKFYSQVSLILLDNAVNAVDYSLNITQQTTVDGYARDIANALDMLEYASVVLRHEPCGVIVSATAKEIHPDTTLAVEEVDSSEHEGTNFAVGGSIRSLRFYDINLVLENSVVQPDGKVTVKIKLAEGVDPAKCKVYHVTDDIVNPLVRFASTIDGNYIVFETEHFSEFAVIEVETVLESIEITQLPIKTVYGAGEVFDASGLRVVANYSDGTSGEIEDYDVGSVNLSTLGEKKVSVYYTFGGVTKSADFTVTVSAGLSRADITYGGQSTNAVNKKVGLFSFYSKASIELDCVTENVGSCTARWSSDNSKVMVDSNGRVTCKGLFGAKKATVTVEFVDSEGNVVASDSVRVVFYKLSFQLNSTAVETTDVFRRVFYIM